MHPTPSHTLLAPAGPALCLTTINPSQLHDLQTSLVGRFPHAVIRTVRGHLTRTMPAFLTHFALAFQFPYHSNETWAEFEQHTAALYAPSANARPHLLLVSHASELLQDAPPRALGDLLKFLAKLHKIWSQSRPSSQGEPASFQVLLQEYRAGVQRLRPRLITAGVLYEPWEPESDPEEAHTSP